MIAELEPCLDGAFAPWREIVTLAAEVDDARPGRDLLRDGVATDLVERFGTLYPGADRRSVASMWTQWYFGAVIVPAAAALLAEDRVLPVALDEIAFRFGEDGRPLSVVLPHAGSASPPQAPDRFAALMEGHVVPLVRHLSPLFGVSAKLLWCNAATLLEWVIRESGPDAMPQAREDGLACLARPLRPCGTRNPLCGVVRDACGACAPQRRICCLRYLLPGMPGCGALCPLPEVSGAGR